MMQLKPFTLLSSVAPILIHTSRRAIPIAAMSTSTDQQCHSGHSGPSALIFLHGLGDTPHGWSSLQRSLPQLQPNLGRNVHYLFPPAPEVSITINGGMRMPGWFDLYDWPIGVEAKDDREGKLRAVERIERAVEELERERGIPPSRVVVGGFSQGGAVALLAAYHRRTEDKVPFAGVVCLSGWLTLKNELTITDEVASSTPLFWGHGEYDDKVLFEQQAHGVEKLKSHGVDVTDKSYPVGHSSDSDEIEAMAEFLDRVLFSSDKE